MADKITASTKELNSDNSINQWSFSYDVEYNSKLNNFCVVVQAEEMTDPSSESEAKTKANIKAKIIKDAWIVDLADATSNVPVITIPETVTL